jgi:predicted nucleotidyltransferase
MKPISDIDIAVITKKPNKKIEAEISSFSSNILDVVNFHRLPLYIQFEVLKHGQPIFIKDKKYFSKVKMEVLKEYLEMSYLYERMSKRVLSR